MVDAGTTSTGDIYSGKTILITGGTGSLGHALVKRFLKTDVRRIIIYSRDEYKQYHMEQEFAAHRARIRYFIGDVRDRARLYRAFTGVDYVIHAAALKHVNLMEYNPHEAVQTNIIGAMNLLDAAIDRGVKKVVALSTDKAVNPVNLYGATKLVSDKLFRAAHAYAAGGTQFVVVRYGNVVGSRGSVIPFFRKLTAEGAESLPITDRRMTRFWITLDQSVDLVVRALETGGGGEVFLSRIPSCLITDIAYAVNPRARLVETGIRPGEKLHEVMLTEDEARSTFDYGDHYVVYPLSYAEKHQEHIRPGGVLVPREFRYASDTNDQWLTAMDLTELMCAVPDEEPMAIGSRA
jgi:UDP-N-acetylglucosamine 4,6-dehydratase (inverting)